MARPHNDEVTKKYDRIIAKVYMQLYRWGFSSGSFESVIAKAAYYILGRSNKRYIGNSDFMDEEDILSDAAIEKIYKKYVKENKPYFLRINYRKTFLKDTAPAEEHLYEVITFFMKYMNQDPEQCILDKPPKCTENMIRKGIWWRFYNGELDGDPVLSLKAIKRKANYPTIKKRTGHWWESD